MSRKVYADGSVTNGSPNGSPGDELPRYGRANRPEARRHFQSAGYFGWIFGRRRKEKDEDAGHRERRGLGCGRFPLVLVLAALAAGLVWFLVLADSEPTNDLEDSESLESSSDTRVRIREIIEDGPHPDPLQHYSKNPKKDILIRLEKEYGGDEAPPKLKKVVRIEKDEDENEGLKDGELDGEKSEKDEEPLVDEDGEIIERPQKLPDSRKNRNGDDFELSDDGRLEDIKAREEPAHAGDGQLDDDGLPVDLPGPPPVSKEDLEEMQRDVPVSDDERDQLPTVDESDEPPEQNQQRLHRPPDSPPGTPTRSGPPGNSGDHPNTPQEPAPPLPKPATPASPPQFYRDHPVGPKENVPYLYTGPPNPDSISLNPKSIPADTSGMESVKKIGRHAWKAWWEVCIAPHIPPESNGTLAQRIAGARLQSYAREYDELRPIERKCHDWAGLPGDQTREIKTNSMMLTAVDSISTFALMKLEPELDQALELCLAWDFRVDSHVSVFETTIRVLGGLLSGWALTGRVELVEKAEGVGMGLLGAFGYRSDWKAGEEAWELPLGTSNLRTGEGRAHGDLGHGTIRISELGTLQLEFGLLADALGPSRGRIFASLVDFLNRQIRLIETELAVEGLWPKRLSRHTRTEVGKAGSISDYAYAVGGEIDSFYEYLLKMWVWGGGFKAGHKVAELVAQKDDLEAKNGWDWARRMWDRSAKAMEKTILHRFVPGKRAGGAASFRPGGKDAMDPVKFHASFAASSAQAVHGQDLEHLACFAPGMFALGAWTFPYDDEKAKKEMWDWAVDTADTCFRMYWDSPVGLGAERVSLRDTPIRPSGGGTYYILRPEVLESVFYVHRLSAGADGRYRAWARFAISAFEKHARMKSGGYTGIQDTGVAPSSITRGDNQETFFLAETVKYLYLIMAGSDAVDLSEWVFNTEAHPLPVRGSRKWNEIMDENGARGLKVQEMEKREEAQVPVPAVVEEPAKAPEPVSPPPAPPVAERIPEPIAQYPPAPPAEPEHPPDASHHPLEPQYAPEPEHERAVEPEHPPEPAPPPRKPSKPHKPKKEHAVKPKKERHVKPHKDRKPKSHPSKPHKVKPPHEPKPHKERPPHKSKPHKEKEKSRKDKVKDKLAKHGKKVGKKRGGKAKRALAGVK